MEECHLRQLSFGKFLRLGMLVGLMSLIPSWQNALLYIDFAVHLQWTGSALASSIVSAHDRQDVACDRV